MYTLLPFLLAAVPLLIRAQTSAGSDVVGYISKNGNCE
jgi:hypothetical protein